MSEAFLVEEGVTDLFYHAIDLDQLLFDDPLLKQDDGERRGDGIEREGMDDGRRGRRGRRGGCGGRGLEKGIGWEDDDPVRGRSIMLGA